jgi:hypothetical protein
MMDPDTVITVGEKALLPDGTHAYITRVEPDQVYGTRTLQGRSFRFQVQPEHWLLLRQGILPRTRRCR